MSPSPSHCFLFKGIPNHRNGSQPHLSGRNARVERNWGKKKHRIDLPLNQQQRKPGHTRSIEQLCRVQAAAAVHSLARASGSLGRRTHIREINAVTPGNAIPSRQRPGEKSTWEGREDERKRDWGQESSPIENHSEDNHFIILVI